MAVMGLISKLSLIQQELKAPKNLYNSFGKYNYRNAEGILESFKAFEDKYKVALILDDDIQIIGDRIYVKATATLYDTEADRNISATAYARESREKKGMDDSQITGAASSYARKYALNGLLLLDDTKDPDTDEFKEQENKGKGETKRSIIAKKNTVSSICKKHKLEPEMICAANGYDWNTISETDVEKMIASLKQKFGDK